MTPTFPTEQIIKSKEFNDLYKTALDFCLFIENQQPTTKVDFMQTTRQHLLRLYTTALELQWVDLQSNTEFDDLIHDADIKPLLNSILESGEIGFWNLELGAWNFFTLIYLTTRSIYKPHDYKT